MRAAESGLGRNIRTSNCLASSPKRMGVSLTGFAIFHLAFRFEGTIPPRKTLHIIQYLAFWNKSTAKNDVEIGGNLRIGDIKGKPEIGKARA